jgi:hypothetical protein
VTWTIYITCIDLRQWLNLSSWKRRNHKSRRIHQNQSLIVQRLQLLLNSFTMLTGSMFFFQQSHTPSTIHRNLSFTLPLNLSHFLQLCNMLLILFFPNVDFVLTSDDCLVTIGCFTDLRYEPRLDLQLDPDLMRSRPKLHPKLDIGL